MYFLFHMHLKEGKCDDVIHAFQMVKRKVYYKIRVGV